MKSHIVNELKQKKIPPKNYNKTKELNRRPIYKQPNALPIGQLGIHSRRGAKHAYKLHHVNVYITAHMHHSLSRVYWTAQVSARLP